MKHRTSTYGYQSSGYPVIYPELPVIEHRFVDTPTLDSKFQRVQGWLLGVALVAALAVAVVEAFK